MHYAVNNREVSAPVDQCRHVTSLGHQEGQRGFREGSKFIETCPIFLKYAKHIFPEGAKKFSRGASPPCAPPGFEPGPVAPKLAKARRR